MPCILTSSFLAHYDARDIPEAHRQRFLFLREKADKDTPTAEVKKKRALASVGIIWRRNCHAFHVDDGNDRYIQTLEGLANLSEACTECIDRAKVAEAENVLSNDFSSAWISFRCGQIDVQFSIGSLHAVADMSLNKAVRRTADSVSAYIINPSDDGLERVGIGMARVFDPDHARLDATPVFVAEQILSINSRTLLA